MSGHSKWKNTKRRKALQDVKRGKIFSKIIRDIETATKLGGKDVSSNSRLRMVLEKALSKNMTKSTFNRAISRHCNGYNKKVIENIVYEGYGPGGTAILLKCFINNKNRVVSEIRYMLSRFGGNLGTDGSVVYLFRKIGVVSCVSNFSEDVIMDMALNVGADDISVHEDGVVKIYVSLELISKMELELQSFNTIFYTSEISMMPYVYVNLNAEDSLKLSSLVDMLRNISGICEIYHNGKFFNDK